MEFLFRKYFTKNVSNRKEMPKQTFSGKLKKGKKISRQRDHLLAVKWKDIRDVFFLTTAHEDVPVEAPSSRGAHHKIKTSCSVGLQRV
jgi:hypothetical protein